MQRTLRDTERWVSVAIVVGYAAIVAGFLSHVRHGGGFHPIRGPGGVILGASCWVGPRALRVFWAPPADSPVVEAVRWVLRLGCAAAVGLLYLSAAPTNKAYEDLQWSVGVGLSLLPVFWFTTRSVRAGEELRQSGGDAADLKKRLRAYWWATHESPASAQPHLPGYVCTLEEAGRHRQAVSTFEQGLLVHLRKYPVPPDDLQRALEAATRSFAAGYPKLSRDDYLERVAKLWPKTAAGPLAARMLAESRQRDGQ